MVLAKRRRVRPSDPVAVVTRFLDAANHHDADGLRACVHADFESFQPLHPVRDFRGVGQLVTNWKAIFEAEPGFRLTLLRASTTGNTVWAEVHGAGASAEAAGIFILGVEDGRIRWIRVYSDLIEPLPAAPAGEEAPDAASASEEEEEKEERGPLRLVPPELAHPRGVPSMAFDPGAEVGAGLRLVGPVTGEEGEDGGAGQAGADAGGVDAVEVLVGATDTEEPAPATGEADGDGDDVAAPPTVDADWTAEGPPEDLMWSWGGARTEAGTTDAVAGADRPEPVGAETVEPTAADVEAVEAVAPVDAVALPDEEPTDAPDAEPTDTDASGAPVPGPAGADPGAAEEVSGDDGDSGDDDGNQVPTEGRRRKGFRFRRGGVRS